MSLYNGFARNCILPLGDLVLGRTVLKRLTFLEKSQWWSRNKLIKYQNKKLRKLIRHAYANVPYYNDLFKKRGLLPKDIQTIEDLNKLPILTKEDIRNNFPDRIIARNIPRRDLLHFASSGSTGEPLRYYKTAESYSYRIACNLRGWSWMDYKLGDKFVKLSQNPRQEANKKIQDFLYRCKYLFSQQLVEESFRIILEEIRAYNPLIIRGYPDPMMFLAKYAKEKGVDYIKPQAITTTGNVLTKEARYLIEKQFSCKIFDSYSCEGSPVLFESPTHDCYLISMEQAISEIISGDKEVREGERGRLISTDLTNYAQPFIRYDTQDLVVKGNRSKCGRELSTITTIDGRDNDILVTPSGKYLIVHNFTGFFQSNEVVLKSVTHFQVLQDAIDRICIFLVVNEDFDEFVLNLIKDYWQDYIGNDIHISVKIVEDIPLTASGKRRFIVRTFDYVF